MVQTFGSSGRILVVQKAWGIAQRILLNPANSSVAAAAYLVVRSNAAKKSFAPAGTLTYLVVMSNETKESVSAARFVTSYQYFLVKLKLIWALFTEPSSFCFWHFIFKEELHMHIEYA